MATREQVYEALKAQLTTLVPGTVKGVERDWRLYTQVATSDKPFLFIVERNEIPAQERGSPASRVMISDIVGLYNAPKNQQPSTVLNALLEAIDGAIAPSPVSGFNTLGGLVHHAWNIGPNQIIEGDADMQSSIIYPMDILMEQDSAPATGQFIFGTGYLYGIPNARPDGSATNLTPVRFANLKEVWLEGSLEHEFASTQLEYKVKPICVGREVRGTARVGTVNAYLLNQIMFGKEMVSGATLMDRERAYTIPAIPFQITVVPPSSGTFSKDLGVLDATTGLLFKRVTASPATGEYSISGAVYTFATADEAGTIVISYLYTLATGNSLTLSNAFKQLAPHFQVVLNGKYGTKQMTVVLNKCITDGFMLPTLLERFTVIDFSFEAVADDNGVLGTMSLA